MPPMSGLKIIYASTSGHTEYVVQTIVAFLQKQSKGMKVTAIRAELAQAADMDADDALILASSTWNTGGPEGQLNPHMMKFLTGHAATVDLARKKVGVIGLGDDRYRYLARAADHLIEFVTSHNGIVIEPVLRIINEPYGQEKKVEEWASMLSKFS